MKRNIEITVSDTVNVRDSFELKSFSEKVKDWISHVISGWFPSKRIDLSPDGVNKLQIIDRKENFYKKKVVDYKTGRVIKDVEEKLSDHN